MPRFSLTSMIRRTRPGMKRRSIVLRDIIPPATMATDLFRSVYLPVIQTLERALPKILAEYERTLSTMTTDSPADVDAQLSFVEQELSRLLLVLTPRLRSWALRVEAWHRGKWRGAVLAATGVDLQTMIGPSDVAETLETVIARNVALVKDVGRQAQARISDAVFRGLTERRPARDVAKDIREAVAMGRRRSIGIASDQLSKVSSSLASERRREAGIDKWKWRSSHKLHFRPEHAARDGKVYTDKTAPADLPGRLPYCGCREQAVVDLD